MYKALLRFDYKKTSSANVLFSVKRLKIFFPVFLYSVSFRLHRTFSTFGIWNRPLYFMKQQVSLSSSRSVNDRKLFPFHLLCVCSVAILKSNTHLSLISPLSLSGIKPIYFQWEEGYLLCFASFFSLQQWFQWDQFVHITSVPTFLVMQFCCDGSVAGQSFSPPGANTPELILFWVSTSCHKSLMDCKAWALRDFLGSSLHRWQTVWCNGEGFAQKHHMFIQCMYCWALKSQFSWNTCIHLVMK